MNIYILLFFITAFTFSQSFNISSKFTIDYESDNTAYAIEEISIIDFDFVIDANYDYDKWQLVSKMGYHLVDGTLLSPSDFTRAQGLQYFPQDKGLNNQRNYWISDMKLQFGDSLSFWYLNKWDKHWGPGINSLTISNKIPSFFHFGLQRKLTNNISFEYFHGKLKSNIDDTLYSRYYDYVGYNPIDINRNIVGHQVEWKPFEQLIISFRELIVYANRELEVTYLLPFVPFFPIQSYVGETDNVIMGSDIQYIYKDNLRLYLEFFMDEWAPTYTFNKDNNNWFGYLTGFKWVDLFITNSVLQVEYTWTDHRVYRHRYPVNDYYSWGYPVGFWAGPHAQEIYLNYLFNIGRNQFTIMLSDCKRGELSYEMLEEQYKTPNPSRIIYQRFDGIVESRKIAKFSINRKFNDYFYAELSFTYLDWNNARFIPSESNSNLVDLHKYSFGFRTSLHY